MIASRRSGFSLVELMVTMVVLVTMAVIAYPNLNSVINSNRLSSAANESMAILQAARMEAIRQNRRTVACLSADPNADAPSCANEGAIGWIVFQDADRDGSFDAGESLLRVTTMPEGVQMIGSAALADGVSFRSDGLARADDGLLLNATVDLCMPVSEPEQNVRHLSIGTGSRIAITKASTPEGCGTPNDTPDL